MDSAKKARARNALIKDYEAKEAEIQVDNPNKKLVYDNQKEVAFEIVNCFMNETVHLAVLIAEMQVGKTGACLETAYRMCTHIDDDKVIDKSNVFIITGLSDKEWKEQTKMSMIRSFEDNVFHRGNFKDKSFILKLTNAHNMLLIIDESHIASCISQEMSKLLKKTNILDLDEIKRRNIRILQVSATPGATLQDALEWGEYSKVFRLFPSPQYVSFSKLFQSGKIRQALDLSNYDNVKKIVSLINDEFKNIPKYHIFRVKGDLNIVQNLTKIAVKNNWKVINHNADDKWDAKFLAERPDTHTFIMILDLWRAAKQLVDINIGIVHESCVKKSDTSTNAQGLAGRCCGNDKRTPGQGTPIIFCSVPAIKQYIAWIDANGSYEDIDKYNSKNINVKNGIVKSTPAIMHHSNIEGLDVEPIVNREFDFKPWNDENGFTDINVLNTFLTTKLKKTVKLRQFMEIDGYMLTTRLTTYYNNRKKGELTSADRLLYSHYNNMTPGTNISKPGAKGQQYMVYPVYPNSESGPEEVRYFYSIRNT